MKEHTIKIRTKSGEVHEHYGTYRELHDVQIMMMKRMAEDAKWMMILQGSEGIDSRLWLRLSEIESILIEE